MRLFTLILAVIASVLPTPVFAEDKDGFRDMKWGDAPTAEFQELDQAEQIQLASSPKQVYFSRPSDKLAIGSTRLERIIYCFDNNELRKVHIFATRRNPALSALQIEQVLKATYGLPEVNEAPLQTGGCVSVWEKGKTRVSLTFRKTPFEELNGTELLLVDKVYSDRERQEEAIRRLEKDAKVGQEDL